MSVGTWGPGTGATGTGSHPFSLRIQGVDYIDAVPLESITVTQSVSGNGTLTFSIVDPTSSLPVPEGWADVEFVDHGVTSRTATGAFDGDAFQDDAFDAGEAVEIVPSEWIFGGLVMDTEVAQGPPGVRLVTVRCVDYGVLLDRVPVLHDVPLEANSNRPLHEIVQQVCAAAPLGGLMALPYYTGGPGRLYNLATMGVFMGYGAETIAARQPVRSAIDAYSERNGIVDWGGRTPALASLYVTPLRQVASLPAGYTMGTAPLEVRQDPTTTAHVAAAAVSVDTDAVGVESGVYVADSETTYGGDNSGWMMGTTNGYTLMPSSISRPLFVASEVATYGAEYLSTRSSGAVTGRATVTSTENFMVGQSLTVYYPDIDLDDTYAIHSVTTRFLGGTDLLRRSEIQFGGELGTVAKFNRTRFARAGVTT